MIWEAMILMGRHRDGKFYFYPELINIGTEQLLLPEPNSDGKFWNMYVTKL